MPRPPKKPLYNETNYSKSWNEFKRGKDYTRITASLRAHGYLDPYMSNMIKECFAAGFRASGVEIKRINQ